MTLKQFQNGSQACSDETSDQGTGKFDLTVDIVFQELCGSRNGRSLVGGGRRRGGNRKKERKVMGEESDKRIEDEEKNGAENQETEDQTPLLRGSIDGKCRA